MSTATVCYRCRLMQHDRCVTATVNTDATPDQRAYWNARCECECHPIPTYHSDALGAVTIPEE